MIRSIATAAGLAAAFLLVAAAGAAAVPDPQPVAGTVRAMDATPTVQLTHEWIDIELHPDHALVSSRFVLRNRGPATHATLGAPDAPAAGGAPALQMDNEPLALAPLPVDAGADATPSWWTAEVAFDAGQIRTGVLRYRVDLPAGTDGRRTLVYDLSRGATWQGIVKNTDFKVRLVDLGPDQVAATPHPMGQKSDELFWEWTEFEPGQREFWPGEVRVSWPAE